tara:strand:+ start:34 stop:1842 length:1809 start_codon:yes stop_codon:yes gene_type:complete
MMVNNLKVNSNNKKSFFFSQKDKIKKFSSLKYLLQFLKPYKIQVIVSTSVLFFTAVLALILPLAVRGIIDGFLNDSSLIVDKFFIISIILAGFLALGTAARFYLVTRLGERIISDIRKEIFIKTISMSPSFFEKILSGEVLSRLTTDTTLILSVISSSVSVALRNILIFIGGFLFMLATSIKLTGLAFLIVPLIIIPILLLGKKLRVLSRESQDSIANISGIASEMLSSAETIQSNTYEHFAYRKFADFVDKSFLIAKKRILVRSILTAMIIFFVFTGIVVVVWVGTYFVRIDTMSAGQLVQFLIFAVLVASSVTQLSEVFGELQRAAGASDRIVELLKVEDTIIEKENSLKLDKEDDLRVEFKNVSFSYPVRKNNLIIDNINFKINPGETVALVGPSGSGKSTIFKLLLRLYDVDEGEININDINIKELKIFDLRNCFSLVPQDCKIFALSIAENVKLSNPHANENEFINSLKVSDLENFINDLPKKSKTYVGEGGILLSGGQKQRVAIARSIIRNSPILLLDEATSSLDSLSEITIQKELENLSKNKKTTLIITHRLSTVKKADRIIVFEKGKIIASGKHADLVKKDGLYSKLAKIQFTD